MKFFEELKKRNVYKAGMAYVVTGWLLLQIVDVIGPGFGWSESTTALLTKILLVGFPIALVLAWLYELTPKGFKRTGTYQEETADNRKAGRRLNYFIIGVLAVAVCFLLVDKVFISGSNNTTDERQEASIANLPEFTSSIAVLAFDDMSPDKDQEYLSDGISEEILNYLAKYKDLNVKSRTSSFAYKGKDVTIDVIGKDLGVAYILEGSVRKAGDTYRITVQLIDTKDGAHIWSDTFDRKIEDVLFVQDEIAGIVAERLNLTLSNEDVRLRKVDPEAYELYLRALDVLKVYNDSTTVIGDSLLRRSIEIDPDYSPSWAILSATIFHRGIYNKHLDREEAIEIGMDAANKAISLDSTNVLAMNWLSNWQWQARKGNQSYETLQKIMSLNPNNDIVFGYAKHAFIRMGKPELALENAYRAVQVSPDERESYKYIARLEDYFDNREKAVMAYEKYLALLKKQTGIEAGNAELSFYYELSGDLEKAMEYNDMDSDRYWRLYYESYLAYRMGQNSRADVLLEKLKQIPINEIYESTGDDSLATHYSNLAHLYATKGDLDNAFNGLNKSFDYYLVYPEELWQLSEYKSLQSDPRWQQFLDRLGSEFNFDYTNQ